jgi:Ca2+-binding RTX toxin-like protein
MATEVGGQNIGITINYQTANTKAIDDFFKAFSGDQNISKTDSGKAGLEIYQSSTGKKLAVFEPGSKKVLKLKEKFGDDAVIGTGKNDKFVADKHDNKVLVTDDASHKILTKGGNDHVVLAGNGNNKVDAGAGNDTIVSGGGNDVIKGGKGADTFVINEKSGDDVIKDFKPGDVLQIADRNGDGNVEKGVDFQVSQNGKHTVISFENGDSVTLKKVDADKLVEDPNNDGIFHI